MKKAFLLLCILAFVSCDSDDDTSSIDSNLKGSWNLISVSCECLPLEADTGEYVWTFDLNARTITVQNNAPFNILSQLETGTYPFTATSNRIRFNDRGFDYYFQDDGALILADMPESDGPLMRFVK